MGQKNKYLEVFDAVGRDVMVCKWAEAVEEGNPLSLEKKNTGN